MEKIGLNKMIKIINTKVFKPYGIKRKGESKLFIDDNGWFIILIEFESSIYVKEAFIKIGVNFNWYLSNAFSYDIEHWESNVKNKKKDFVVYTDNEEQFVDNVDMLCKFAIEEINEYRNKFKNINDAEKVIIENEYTSDNLWGNYHRGIVSGLIKNKTNLNKYFNKLLEEPENDINWIIELKKQTKELSDLGNKNIEEFSDRIKKIITETRKLKKLDIKEIDV
jgi:hypothetical protein